MKRPAHLGSRGRRVWDFLTNECEPRPDELAVIHDLVQTLTLVDKIDAELAKPEVELLMPASHGGWQANPLVSERRQLAAAANALWKSLKIEDTEKPADLHVIEDSRPHTAREARKVR